MIIFFNFKNWTHECHHTWGFWDIDRNIKIEYVIETEKFQKFGPASIFGPVSVIMFSDLKWKSDSTITWAVSFLNFTFGISNFESLKWEHYLYLFLNKNDNPFLKSVSDK